ncbi:CPBP family intramembrane glutamic endopeptidase [Clostridium fungisolvens]|uniref:CAAX prenyl protease 2/Lysostaphin resistance protein A-like domain-containing protein n=1 Tax=Clostridium fungisolvens TaxID=1604897 RepID=A0A6V8SHT6_9CLOT|nr:CPBP family intramembrane glutamic endopeptidase [Clostridium fungisolvens]GFP76296.1 hypothetical protein bsdtw1_02398 [Clostridium fungisolvens]
MKKFMQYAKEIPSNIVFQSILAFIFSIPLISTLGQFITSGFISKNTSVLILYWPGVTWNFSVNLPVWLIFGIIAASYVVGIAYMFKNRIFGKIVVIGFIGLIVAQIVGIAFSTITNFKELQQVSSVAKAGVVNRMLFSLWHNPAWEEIVFRGLPLICLMALKKRLSKKRYNFAIALYFIIPSIAMALYHIPNHGASRIADTLVLSLVFAWLAFKYTFFAPLIMHYIADSITVLYLGDMKGIPKNEVLWLSNNSGLINSAFSIGIIVLLISIPFILIYNIKKMKKADTLNYNL